MRRFSRVGTGRFEPVQIMGGPKSRAIVQRPPDIDRPGAEYAHPTLSCRVAHNSLVNTGQVVRLQGGDHYLVCDHSATIDWRTHHLFMCDREVDWKRPAEVIDPLTKLKKQSGPPVELGTMWVMWERVRREFTDLNIRIDQETHLVATGAAIEIDDTLAGMKVKRVNRALGVNIVELQG